MSKRIEAIVKPDLLIWARESAGFTKEDAAHKLGVKLQKLGDWETGTSRPTIKQLRKLGQIYKRPIAVFYSICTITPLTHQSLPRSTIPISGVP